MLNANETTSLPKDSRVSVLRRVRKIGVQFVAVMAEPTLTDKFCKESRV